MRYRPGWSWSVTRRQALVLPLPGSPVSRPIPRRSSRCLQAGLGLQGSGLGGEQLGAAGGGFEGQAGEAEMLAVHQGCSSGVGWLGGQMAQPELLLGRGAGPGGGLGPGGSLRLVRNGRPTASRAGVDLQIDQGRLAGFAVLVQDRQGPPGGRVGLDHQGDLLAGQAGHGLVLEAPQVDRAGAADAAHEAVAEDPPQVDVGSGIAHVVTDPCQAVQRRFAVEAAVGRMVTCCGAGNVAMRRNALVSQR